MLATLSSLIIAAVFERQQDSFHRLRAAFALYGKHTTLVHRPWTAWTRAVNTGSVDRRLNITAVLKKRYLSVNSPELFLTSYRHYYNNVANPNPNPNPNSNPNPNPNTNPNTKPKINSG